MDASDFSRRDEGVDGYQVSASRDPDAFPAPKWPPQTLGELIGITFADRLIETADHPGLLRLLGAKQTRVVSAHFGKIVVCDFEYEVSDGNLPAVLVLGCVRARRKPSARSYSSAVARRFRSAPPFDTGADTLVRCL